jgi:hypothetical protein
MEPVGNPSGYSLGRRVPFHHLIDIPVVKLTMNDRLDMTKVHQHPFRIQFMPTKLHLYDPVMTVNSLAWRVIG